MPPKDKDYWVRRKQRIRAKERAQREEEWKGRGSKLVDPTAESERATHVIMRLADFECVHGRLGGDSTPACGCWDGEDPYGRGLISGGGAVEPEAGLPDMEADLNPTRGHDVTEAGSNPDGGHAHTGGVQVDTPGLLDVERSEDISYDL